MPSSLPECRKLTVEAGSLSFSPGEELTYSPQETGNPGVPLAPLERRDVNSSQQEPGSRMTVKILSSQVADCMAQAHQ